MSDFPIFSVLGIEIEYMLVNRDSLDVQPQSDVILEELAGKLVNEIALGDIAVSNELVLHVLELKNNGPKPVTAPLANQFQTIINKLQPILNQHQLQLLPSGAHPWMNPLTETKRWPHGNKDIYNTYDAIFNCQGHGWSNLQSMHVNLPFANADEFFHLHSGIRLLLPLLPSLAASTPFLEAKKTGLLDSRLYFYAKNQQKIPSISGDIIPEFIQSPSEYEQTILNPMYKDISALDPAGLLQFEWLNSRAAIAKFNYNAIEIRIIDTQECVNADIAIAHMIHALLKTWHERTDYHLNNACSTSALKNVYDQSIKHGMNVNIDDGELLTQWQLPKRTMTLRDVWSLLIERVSPDLSQTTQLALENILRHGNLSERIIRACNMDYSKPRLKQVYRQLAECLLTNQLFESL